MRKFLVAISFFFCALPAYAKVDTSWFDKGCMQFEGNWRLVRDDEAEAIAKELLARAGIVATPVVCSSSENSLDLAGGYMWTYEPEKFFFIQLNGDFRLAIGRELRGVIAHEVGHYVYHVNCNTLLRAGENEKFLKCEHEVDMAGERLAGDGSVLKMLRWTEHYLSQHTNPYGRSSEILWNLRRRILLAEQEARKAH